jgi:hypothetical protein
MIHPLKEENEEDANGKKRVKTVSQPAQKRRKCEPKQSPLEVLMKEKDVPAAPGTKPPEQEDGDGFAPQGSSFTDDDGGTDQAVKNRIMKLLNTGFHQKSNENEAKNAIKIAQRLMTKHNLSQAKLLEERDAREGKEQELLKGGLVEVKVINRKTRKPSQMARWITSLADHTATNFAVQYFYTVCRGRECSVTFYGIYTNCQLAAYAFRVATERIAQMAAEHKPVKRFWKNISTKSSRLSYALGIVRGIGDEVDSTLRREKERRDRKLERLRQAESKGEVYEESDDDEDAEDVGPGYPFPARDGAVDLDNNDDDDLDKKPAAGLSGDALFRRLQEMEDEKQTALVLADHREKVEKQVLEEEGIEISSVPKLKPISFDRLSYDKGIEDSKEIDINQRAIKDDDKKT